MPSPATQPATREAVAAPFEREILRFIAVSRQVLPGLLGRREMEDRSPQGFAELAAWAREDSAMREKLLRAGMTAEVWSASGGRIWSAWSVAQVDYNAEAPLRENRRKLAEAQAKLIGAQETIKRHVRVLSPAQRAERVAAARDAVVNATDRAEMWAQKASDLRDQIAASSELGARPVAGEPAAISAAQGDAASALGGARGAMLQDLAVAERNERQAREDSRRAAQRAQHPEQPQDNSEESDLLRQSQGDLEQARSEIAREQAEMVRIESRLRDDRRVNADARQKAASEEDIALLRRHLAEFNDAWGLTPEGRLKPPPADVNAHGS